MFLDSILEPLTPKTKKVEDFIDIKASNILKESNKYRIGDYSISKFAKRIEQLGFQKFPEFAQYGKMTFFLPVDSAFDVRANWNIHCIILNIYYFPYNLESESGNS